MMGEAARFALTQAPHLRTPDDEKGEGPCSVIKE
jgi:hypothetical protein